MPSLPKPIRGIVPPLITPLNGRDELDLAGLQRLIEYQIAGGVAGLFILWGRLEKHPKPELPASIRACGTNLRNCRGPSSRAGGHHRYVR